MVQIPQLLRPSSEVEIVVHKEFSVMDIYIRTDGIMNIVFKQGKLITMDHIAEVKAWVSSLGPKKYLNLFEGGQNTDFDAKVREYSASRNENKFTIADAFVVKSLAHQMVANFYLQFNKPCKPTKMFKTREAAIAWLLSFDKVQQSTNFYKPI